MHNWLSEHYGDDAITHAPSQPENSIAIDDFINSILKQSRKLDLNLNGTKIPVFRNKKSVLAEFSFNGRDSSGHINADKISHSLAYTGPCHSKICEYKTFVLSSYKKQFVEFLSVLGFDITKEKLLETLEYLMVQKTLYSEDLLDYLIVEIQQDKTEFEEWGKHSLNEYIEPEDVCDNTLINKLVNVYLLYMLSEINRKIVNPEIDRVSRKIDGIIGIDRSEQIERHREANHKNRKKWIEEREIRRSKINNIGLISKIDTWNWKSVSNELKAVEHRKK